MAIKTSRLEFRTEEQIQAEHASISGGNFFKLAMPMIPSSGCLMSSPALKSKEVLLFKA